MFKCLWCVSAVVSCVVFGIVLLCFRVIVIMMMMIAVIVMTDEYVYEFVSD